MTNSEERGVPSSDLNKKSFFVCKQFSTKQRISWSLQKYFVPIFWINQNCSSQVEGGGLARKTGRKPPQSELNFWFWELTFLIKNSGFLHTFRRFCSGTLSPYGGKKTRDCTVILHGVALQGRRRGSEGLGLRQMAADFRRLRRGALPQEIRRFGRRVARHGHGTVSHCSRPWFCTFFCSLL